MPANQKRLIIFFLIFTFLCIRVSYCQSESALRLMQQSDDGLRNEIKKMVTFSIEILSKIINVLKRILVLMTLLFLIENMINFWILASSYVFLAVQMPEYFKTTISGIYSLYNESFLHYIGLDIQYPNFTVTNQIYHNLPNQEVYQFNPIQFALQPTLLLILTLIQLSFFKWVVKVIKKKAKERRQEYLREAIQVEAGRKLEKKEDQLPKTQLKNEREKGSLALTNIFRNNKVDNQAVRGHQKTSINFILELTFKVMEQNTKQELSKGNYKHWSEDIHVNTMEKIAALIINFMTGLLMPSFSLAFQNRLGSFWEKINLMLYYLLLGLIFLFPFLYISRNVRDRAKHHNNKATLKSSDVQTLCQYFLNMSMSVTIGIRTSPFPFLITTFTVLSLLLVHSFMEGGLTISCQSMSMKKINTIVHKLTFWLFNLIFLGMCVLMRVKQSQTTEDINNKFEEYAEYCSIACLGLFAIGGCHELLEFGINTVITFFKVIHMIFVASNKEQYQKSEKKQEISELQPQLQSFPEEVHFQEPKENIFNSFQERENESQSSEIIRTLKKRIMDHQKLLKQVQQM